MTRFLRRLAVSQFRSHAATALDLDARPVALFGPNGAGKTNLLEAVSTLSPGRGLRGAAVADMARAPGALGWRVRAALETPEGLREIVVTGEAEGRRRVEIDGKPEPHAALGALAPMLWLTPAMDRLWTEGAEGRRRFLDRAALSFFPMHGAAALAYEKAMRERNRLLRDGPADPAWLSALEARMAEAGVAIAAARAATAARLIAAQRGVKTLFPMAEIGIIGPMEQHIAAAAEAPSAPPSEHPEIVEDFRAALARGRRDDAAAGRALTGPHRSDLEAIYAAKGVPARLCSTGEQKALLISLVLANARALAAETGSAPILLLDEVAAHLDMDRRAALFDEVSALGAQAWMTATGPELFDALGPRSRRFAVAEGPDGSTVREAA